jgi:hypothetical protein
MNRLEWFLASTTVIFTATAVYHAHALQEERETLEALRTTSAFPGPAGDSEDRKPALGPSTNPAAAGVTIDAAAATGAATGSVAVARDQLEQLRDPAERLRQFDELVDARKDDLKYAAGQIGLTPLELDTIAAKLAEKELVRRQRRLECRINPACDMRSLSSSFALQAREDTAEAMGPEVYARYQAFSESAAERVLVDLVHTQLDPGDVFTAAQEARLLSAMSEEGQRFAAEAREQGLQVETDFAGLAAIRASHRAGSPDQREQRALSAEAYQQRLASRASTLLTPGQLSAFRAAQQLQLESYKTALEEAAIREAARARGGKP